MAFRTLATSLAVGALLLSASSAHAHFLWLVSAQTDSGKTVARAHFSEESDDPEPELLKRLEGLKVWHRSSSGEIQALAVQKTSAAFEADVPQNLDLQSSGIVFTEKNFGVSGRGDVKFLLQYYAKLYAGDVAAATKLGTTERLRLDIVPVIEGRKLTLHVSWEGKPVAESEVVVKGPGLKGDKIKTDAKGLVQIELAEAGPLEIRARHIENKGGEHEGKTYTEIRHYCSLTMPYKPMESVKTSGR